MKKLNGFKVILIAVLILMLQSCSSQQGDEKTSSDNDNPNIVIIYLDDLGYGDVSAYGATEIQTPNIDRLANEGVMFTDGHASSSTCTPSRYALLTGTYPWKNKDAKILPGTAPLIIDTAQATLPKMLKEQGYHTALVGKWHLGLGTGVVNWNKHVSPGPNEVGFDYAYYMAATQDRVPTVYLENGLVQGLDPNDPIEIDYKNNFEGQPTGKDNPELCDMMWHHGHNATIINGIPRIGYMKGGEAAKWNDIDMADHFLDKAKAYIKTQKDEPFFLYYAMQQPHVPRTPHPRFIGTSGMGPRGDVIIEADWCIGELVKTLEELEILDNTLIILTSDNGPVVNDGYYDDAVEKLGDHTPAGQLRGGKYSLYEAGTRVPFITYWKGKIQPAQSDALVCQMDLLTSLASLVDAESRVSDSEDLLDAFLGKSATGREELIIEATSRTALRSGDWLMIPPYKGSPINKQVNIELGNSKKYQLYNLNEDLGQIENMADAYPELRDSLVDRYFSVTGAIAKEVEELELK